MSLVSVHGVYKNGRIELDERPGGVGESARVIVTFLPAGETEQARPESAPDQEARREAGKRLMAILREGIPLGGPPYPTREELYDRVDRFDDQRRDG